MIGKYPTKLLKLPRVFTKQIKGSYITIEDNYFEKKLISTYEIRDTSLFKFPLQINKVLV